MNWFHPIPTRRGDSYASFYVSEGLFPMSDMYCGSALIY
jgi:hypothetical protein